MISSNQLTFAWHLTVYLQSAKKTPAAKKGAKTPASSAKKASAKKTPATSAKKGAAKKGKKEEKEEEEMDVDEKEEKEEKEVRVGGGEGAVCVRCWMG